MTRGGTELPDIAAAGPTDVAAWLRTLSAELPTREQVDRLRRAAEQCDRAAAGEVGGYAGTAAALLRHVAEDTMLRAGRVEVETWATITDDVTLSYEMVPGSVAVSFTSPPWGGPVTSVHLRDADVVVDKVLDLLHRARADYRQTCVDGAP